MCARGLAKRAAKAVYRSMPFKRPVFELLRHLHLPNWLVQRLRFEGVVDVRVDAQRKFLMHNYASNIESDLFWRGYGNGWEGTSLKVWGQLVPLAQTIVDIGAHTGVYALAAKCFNPDAKVIAFEPVPRTFRRFEANIVLNRYDILLEELAVSDRSGVATIFDTPAGHADVASLESRHFSGRGPTVSSEVRTVRFDDYLERSGSQRIDLVKIDVERHEPSVLRGFGASLAADMPTILLEVLAEDIAGEVESLVGQLGYDKYEVLEGRGIRKMETISPSDSGRNVLLCRPAVFAAAELGQFLLRD